MVHITRPSSGGVTILGYFDKELDAAKQYDKYAKVGSAGQPARRQ